MRRVLRLLLFKLLAPPETLDELVAVLPDAHFECVGDRGEWVIYTGWDSDELGKLVPMKEDA